MSSNESQHEKAIKTLKQRDVEFRKQIIILERKHKKKEQHQYSELVQLKKQLTNLKWMLQLYQNKAHLKDEEHYKDFEKISKTVRKLAQDVEELKRDSR